MQALAISFIILVQHVRSDIIDLTHEDFDEIVKEHPVFIKFYSPTCPHCQKLVPIWEKVGSMAPTYPQYFMVGDVDCSVESSLCDRFGVRGVPTLIYFNEGRMYKFLGSREYNDIMKFGAGDYKQSAESHEIPVRGGLIESTRYTLVKFIKDLHAILRFNYWAAVIIFIFGFMSGSLVTFAISILATRNEFVPPSPVLGSDKALSLNEPVSLVDKDLISPEKGPEAKKLD